MEISGTENAHYNISSGSIEVNFDGINGVGDYATLTVEDRDSNTYSSLEKPYMNVDVEESPNGENDTKPEERKDTCRTTMIASPKEKMYICVLTAVIVLLVISVGIIVFLLVSSKSEDHCASNPCYHGRCESTANDFKCACDNEFTGATCDTRINMCDTTQCVHGKCYDNSEGFVCVCDMGYEGLYCENTVATDCYDIYNKNVSQKSGVYSVALWKSKQATQVYCDMDTFPYGWTVFQKRFNGYVEFYRNFSEYTNGFGNFHGEFWLGLRFVEEIASQYESDLRLDLTAADNSHVYEQFENFSLSKYPAFTLHLGRQTVEQISGNRYGFYYLKGADFSTFDHDADQHSKSCAELQRGGWWYRDCAKANLNGPYLSPPGTISSFHRGWGGFIYYTWKGFSTLKSSKVMFRKHTS